jgi:hypothetical protein
VWAQIDNGYDIRGFYFIMKNDISIVM